MALTVTPGGPADDSLLDLAPFKTYATDRGWVQGTVTDAQIEASLRKGTLWVEGTWRSRFSGKKTNGRSQSREWPRTGALDADGYTIDDATIPTEVESAVAEATLVDLASSGVLDKVFKPGDQKILTEVKGVKWTPMEAGGDSLRAVVQAAEDAIGGVLIPDYEGTRIEILSLGVDVS